MMKKSVSKNKTFEMFGDAILLASIQASIASVELSSKYSVVNFSKDQQTLQAASDALTGYLIIAFIWLLGSVSISYGKFGWQGLVTSLVANLILVGWIFFSYIQSFKIAASRYNLQFPKLFRLTMDLGNVVPIDHHDLPTN